MKIIICLLAFTFYLLVVQTIEAHPSWGIVVDKNENIYFADISHNGMGSVWMLTNKGELKLLLSDFHAHNVSLDKHGNLITAHGEIPHTLVRIRENGTIDTLYQTNDYKEFFGGNCAWSAGNEKVIYGLRDHKYLRALDPNGNQKNIGDYEFIWNQSIYVAADGTIYATEIGRDNGCIVKIDTNGTASIIAQNLITRLDREKDIHQDILLGITEGYDGNIYVAETAGRRVVKILEHGNTETFYRSENNWTPTAIDFSSEDAYILEYKDGGQEVGPRIVRINKSGSSTVIFNYDTYEKGEIIPTMQGDKMMWWIGIPAAICVSIFVFLLRKMKKHSPTNRSNHPLQDAGN